MKLPEDQCAAIFADIEPLTAEDRARYLGEVIVTLMEHLGYTLAHVADAQVSTSAFVLATDVEKRLRAIETAMVARAT